MTVSHEVAITGLGAIGAAGLGVGALERALAEGRVPLSEVDRSGGYHVESSARLAALVGPIDTREWVPALVARRLSPPSRHALIAGRMALRHAGIAPERAAPAEGGVALATSFGPSSYTERLLDQILDEGPASASPMLFTECVANAPAAQLAIHSNLRGPNYTFCAREAGVLMSCGRGAAEIRSGRAPLMLVGGVEEITPLVHAMLDRFRALARATGQFDERARPFDRRRNGFVAAEGAAVVVLESPAAARLRGAEVRAWLLGWGRAFDFTAKADAWGRGAEALALALREGLERQGIDLESIELIVSGASGSVAGDRLEAKILSLAWRASTPPLVVAPKSVTGEYGGGFLAAAVLATLGARVEPAGDEERDPDLAFEPRGPEPGSAARRVLVLSLASGGAMSWLVLERG